jgi:Ricin-type beta-trefoil lectin domain
MSTTRQRPSWPGGRLLRYLTVISLLAGSMAAVTAPAQAWCRPGIPGCGEEEPGPAPSPGPKPSPKPPPPPDAKTIRSGSNPGFCLDLANFTVLDVPVIQTACNGTTGQIWNFEFEGRFEERDRVYNVWKIVNYRHGACLDVLGGGTNSGSKVVTNICTGRGSQQWLNLEPIGYGSSTFLINMNTVHGFLDNMRCLDVPGATTAVVHLQIWSCHYQTAQQFTPMLL